MYEELPTSSKAPEREGGGRLATSCSIFSLTHRCEIDGPFFPLSIEEHVYQSCIARNYYDGRTYGRQCSHFVAACQSVTIDVADDDDREVITSNQAKKAPSCFMDEGDILG